MRETKIDRLLDLLSKQKRADLPAISRSFGWDMPVLEKAMQGLDRLGIVRLHYPLNVFSKPWVELRQRPTTTIPPTPKGKLLDHYPVEGLHGHLRGNVTIFFSQDDKRPFYFSESEDVSPATWTFFELLKDDITRQLPLEEQAKEGVETPHDLEIRHRIISSVIAHALQPSQEDLEVLCGLLLRDMYALGNLELLIADPWLEEIIINSASQSIAVYHRLHGWLRTNLTPGSEQDVENYAAQIARKVGKQISLLNPILDAHLLSGDRVNATLFPISTQGNTLTLRLFARQPWTLPRLIQSDPPTIDITMAAILWQAIHYEMNVVIGGGTASGKTSLLNSLVALIPPYQRIVTIEDTRELSLPSYQWNWVPLVTRTPNPEGLGRVTMLDLVVNSLRMRPDRIIMGEIRRKREAEVLFEAMHTGHSVYATFHADTASQLLKRLTEPPIAVPKVQVEDIHLIVIQYRDRRRNLRRVSELVEVSPGQSGPELNYIYSWRARTDTFELVRKPRRYIEQLNLHTGMTEREIENDQKRKTAVLRWMADQKLFSLEHVGAVMKAYYADEAVVVAGAKKKQSPEKLLGITIKKWEEKK